MKFDFSPITGTPILRSDDLHDEAFYRAMSQSEGREWLFNPWTGHQRGLLDMATDPHGILITPPGESLKAAPIRGAESAALHSLGVPPARLSEAPATVISSDSIGAMLCERGERYGEFATCAEITQGLKRTLMRHVYVNNTEFEADQLEALDMICHKLSRIVNGDPNYADSWDDIAGYAKLVGDRLRGVSW